MGPLDEIRFDTAVRRGGPARGGGAVRRIRLALVIALAAGCTSHSGYQQLLQPGPELQRPAPEVCRIRLDTTKGAIVLEVRRAWAPRGADRFYDLVRAGYYDDTAILTPASSARSRTSTTSSERLSCGDLQREPGCRTRTRT